MYTVQFTAVAVTAQQDLFQIEAVTVPAIIHQIVVSQSSDFGDAAAENLVIKLRRVTDALTDVTVEALLDLGDSAALADLNVNDTTQLVTGVDTFHVEGWNIAQPFVFLPPPELRPVCQVGNVIVVTMSAPADALTIHGTMYFEETGA